MRSRVPSIHPACGRFLAGAVWALAGLVLGSGEEGKPVTTRSVAADRVAAEPGYAHTLGEAAEGLVFGVESRTRVERRWEDYGWPGMGDDEALVTRNLVYAGMTGMMDPLRLSLELEDSRRFWSDRPDNPNVENGLEVLQAFAQLRFEEAAWGEALSVSAGRMVFDWADRRLVARNRNRNVISAFDGVRVRLGEEESPWEVDAIAVRPVERRVEEFDVSSDRALLWGVAGYWRGASPRVVLEPYWLWLDQSDLRGVPIERELHTIGLHGFGRWGEGGEWDYDVSVAGQWGETQGEEHRAWAGHAEVGRSFGGGWNPRLALWLNYASGDQGPRDGSNERFDPLFGATYAFYGYSGYFAWQNLINPALRLSFRPMAKLQVELMHRAMWLASDTDAWVRGLRRDESGGSGSHIGQEANARLVWQVSEHFDIDLAYAHFFPGGFARATGAAPAGDFVQIAGTLRF